MRSGRPPLPSSGVWGLGGEDGHRESLLLLRHLPSGQGGSCSRRLAAPRLAGLEQSKLLWQGNAALGGGTQLQAAPEGPGSRHRILSASGEVGSRDPSRLSLSGELLLEPVTVLGDSWLLGCWGRWGQSHPSREF